MLGAIFWAHQVFQHGSNDRAVDCRKVFKFVQEQDKPTANIKYVKVFDLSRIGFPSFVFRNDNVCFQLLLLWRSYPNRFLG